MKKFIFIFTALFLSTIAHANITDIGLLNEAQKLSIMKAVLLQNEETSEEVQENLFSILNDMIVIYDDFKDLYANGSDTEYIKSKLRGLKASVEDVTYKYKTQNITSKSKENKERIKIMQELKAAYKKFFQMLRLNKNKSTKEEETNPENSISETFQYVDKLIVLFNIELNRISNAPYNMAFASQLQSQYNDSRFIVEEYIEAGDESERISDLSRYYRKFEGGRVKFEEILTSCWDKSIPDEEIVRKTKEYAQAFKYVKISTEEDEMPASKKKSQENINTAIITLNRISSVYLTTTSALLTIYDNN